MKKVVALFLCVVMMMSLCACDLFSSGIKITKENYETYLNISCSIEMGDPIDYAQAIGSDRSSGVSVYTSITPSLTVSGKSELYDYSDIEVVVKITGSYLPYTATSLKQINKNEIDFEEYYEENNKQVELTLSAVTDVVGAGVDSETIKLDANKWVLDESDNFSYEVIEVKGKLKTP